MRSETSAQAPLIAGRQVPQLAWRGVLLAIALAALLHAWFLGSLSGFLPQLGLGATQSVAPQVFSTRSMRIDNGAPRSTPPAAPAPPKAKPAKRSAARLPSPGELSSTVEPSASLPLQSQDTASQLQGTLASGAPTPTESVAPVTAAPIQAASAAPPAAPASAALATINPNASPATASVQPSADAPSSAKGATQVYNYLFPASTRLKYDVAGIVKGFKYYVSGDLQWLHDGSSYTARLEISHFLLGSRIQTSKGAMTSAGLEPLRFGEKVRSEVAAHFEREKGKVSFSANTPDAPLTPMAQDQVSIFVQLAAMLAADPSRFVPGTDLVFQTVGARGSEEWAFRVGPSERLTVQGKEMLAYKLTREHHAEFDTRAELWLAPALDYLPARIRLSQTSGDEIDMVWVRSQKP